MKFKKSYILFIVLGSHWIFASYVTVKDANFFSCIKASHPNLIKYGNHLDIDLAATVTGTLDFSGKGIKDVDEIVYFKNISQLILSNNSLESIPSLSGLKYLTYLDLSVNSLNYLPPLGENNQLEEIILFGNNLKQIPSLDSLVDL